MLTDPLPHPSTVRVPVPCFHPHNTHRSFSEPNHSVSEATCQLHGEETEENATWLLQSTTIFLQQQGEMEERKRNKRKRKQKLDIGMIPRLKIGAIPCSCLNARTPFSNRIITQFQYGGAPAGLLHSASFAPSAEGRKEGEWRGEPANGWSELESFAMIP